MGTDPFSWSRIDEANFSLQREELQGSNRRKPTQNTYFRECNQCDLRKSTAVIKDHLRGAICITGH